MHDWIPPYLPRGFPGTYATSSLPGSFSSYGTPAVSARKHCHSVEYADGSHLHGEIMMQVQLTSYQAHERLLPKMGERQTEVYRALQEIGPATDWEITKHLGKNDPNYVRPRRRDLANPEKFNPPLVEEVEKRTCSVTRETAIAWNITKNNRW